MGVNSDVGDTERLAAVSVLATGLRFTWVRRVEKKVSAVRAELEEKVDLLRKTRYRKVGDLIYAIIIQS